MLKNKHILKALIIALPIAVAKDNRQKQIQLHMAVSPKYVTHSTQWQSYMDNQLDILLSMFNNV